MKGKYLVGYDVRDGVLSMTLSDENYTELLDIKCDGVKAAKFLQEADLNGGTPTQFVYDVVYELVHLILELDADSCYTVAKEEHSYEDTRRIGSSGRKSNSRAKKRRRKISSKGGSGRSGSSETTH